MKLNREGITVYQAIGRTVRENIELIASSQLPKFQPGHVAPLMLANIPINKSIIWR